MEVRLSTKGQKYLKSLHKKYLFKSLPTNISSDSDWLDKYTLDMVYEENIDLDSLKEDLTDSDYQLVRPVIRRLFEEGHIEEN